MYESIRLEISYPFSVVPKIKYILDNRWRPTGKPNLTVIKARNLHIVKAKRRITYNIYIYI